MMERGRGMQFLPGSKCPKTRLRGPSKAGQQHWQESTSTDVVDTIASSGTRSERKRAKQSEIHEKYSRGHVQSRDLQP